jgi:hypothetical protein
MAKAKADPAEPKPEPSDFMTTAADFERTVTGADLSRLRGYLADERMNRRPVADRLTSEWKALVASLRTVR